MFPSADTGRHVLDVAYLRDELRLAPRVISLLERLPYVNKTSHSRPPWYPWAGMVDYRDNGKARGARDPNHLCWQTTAPSSMDHPDTPDLGCVRSTGVTLALPINGYQQIILDTLASQW